MNIRMIKESDLLNCEAMVKRSILSMSDYYPESIINESIEHFNFNLIKKNMAETHLYVCVQEEKIVGCGGIVKSKREDEVAYLTTFFIDPQFQRKGIGQKILKVLENDEIARKNKKIKVFAAIGAIPFYIKSGYKHIDNVLNYDDGKFLLEKEIKNG